MCSNALYCGTRPLRARPRHSTMQQQQSGGSQLAALSSRRQLVVYMSLIRRVEFRAIHSRSHDPALEIESSTPVPRPKEVGPNPPPRLSAAQTAAMVRGRRRQRPQAGGGLRTELLQRAAVKFPHSIRSDDARRRRFMWAPISTSRSLVLAAELIVLPPRPAGRDQVDPNHQTKPTAVRPPASMPQGRQPAGANTVLAAASCRLQRQNPPATRTEDCARGVGGPILPAEYHRDRKAEAAQEGDSSPPLSMFARMVEVRADAGTGGWKDGKMSEGWRGAHRMESRSVNS